MCEAPVGGGLELLRAVARSRKMGLASLAHELGTSAHLLEAFIAGGMLPIKTLNGIAEMAFGTGVTYDSEVDLLRRAPRPAGPPSLRCSRRRGTRRSIRPVDREMRLYPPDKSKPPQPKRPAPGWAD